MAIRYYPSTRIKTDLYTRGDTYRLPNGERYSGAYYLTYDGKAYAGANPNVGTNVELVKVVLDKAEQHGDGGRPKTLTTETYAAIEARSNNKAPDSDAENGILQELRPYYPVPLESDYTRGYFTRYFAKQLTGPGFIIEISESDWSNLENGLTQQTFVAYEVTSMLWQLTGPLNDRRISQYQVKGGVFDTNKRVTEGKEATFRGIVSYIGGDYTKFARITP